MPQLYHQYMLTRFSHYAKAASIVLILISCIVFVRWEFNIIALKTGATAMNPSGTALAFLFTGISLLAQQIKLENRGMRLFGRAAAYVVLIIALTRLCSDLFLWGSGPEQMLFLDKLNQAALFAGYPNRMELNTAVTFLLVSFSLQLLDIKVGRFWPAQFLALGSGFIALLTMISYAYSFMMLSDMKYTDIPMALNTAVAFFLVNTAILCARPDRGIIAVISGTGAGGVQARRLLPMAIIIPAGLFWLEYLARRAGALDQIRELSLFVLLNIFFFTVLIWWSAALMEESDQKRFYAEERLQKEKEAAEKASKVKSEFLANMSHELRTPLNSIIGLNRMIYEDKNVAEDHREMIGIAYRAANNLLNIVNDILDLSKIEAEALLLEKVTFALEEVVNNVMEVFLPLCHQKGLSLRCNFPADHPPYLIGDPMRLGRIMVNLVGNAIKYTEKGSVVIDISCLPDPGDPKHMILKCSVTDTGIGIPEDQLDNIFEEFAQVDSSITRRYGGTGLGLSIAQRLVENMGGKIGVESAFGKGSRFWFTITFPTSEVRPEIDKILFQYENARQLPPEERRKAEDVKILVGEDHPLNQAYIKRLLPQLGFKDCDIADNGKMLVDTLGKKAYDLILMDCHMPVMSGYEATDSIRAGEKGTSRHIPIIAMTADAMAGTRERCLLSGMDDYISKPINPDELRHIMSRWITFPGENDDTGAGEKSSVSAGTPSGGLAALREFADNEADMRKLVTVFTQETEENLNELRENCSDGYNQAWAEAAHKLKGGAATLKAEKLRALCEQARKMENAAAIERQAVLDKIQAAYDEVKSGLLAALSGDKT
ncbi:MAG: response regulator [Alphaproteobacteria bacterium]|nr:response regulator [Alphaproteobacteria bacterium]